MAFSSLNILKVSPALNWWQYLKTSYTTVILKRPCSFASRGELFFSQHHRNIHYDNKQDEQKTIKQVIERLVEKVGASKSFHQNVDRRHLLDMLPKSQKELPERRMKDSWDSALIPIGSNNELREKYVTFMGGVRFGRLLEDMDVFAVWLCYKHVLNPLQREDAPSPYSIVTALVDKIDFHKGLELVGDKDIRLEGHVSWVGRSSLEVTIYILQEVEDHWKQITRAVFVMVARDPLNQGSAVINPLICESEEEKQQFQQGEINKLSRRKIQEESLFIAPPNETEKSLVHNLFMGMASKDQLSFEPKNLPENAVWMSSTKLKNLIICHPESSNIFNKIFGGFLMRQAYELSFANATVFSKQRPRIMHIDDIMFRRPVEVGSLLYLNSQVTYTDGNYLQISTKASVVDAIKETSNLTNIFHFTFKLPDPVIPSIPKTYHEAMLYLDGRRHFQLVRGIRKFYAQGEMVTDSGVTD